MTPDELENKLGAEAVVHAMNVLDDMEELKKMLYRAMHDIACPLAFNLCGNDKAAVKSVEDSIVDLYKRLCSDDNIDAIYRSLYSYGKEIARCHYDPDNENNIYKAVKED